MSTDDYMVIALVIIAIIGVGLAVLWDRRQRHLERCDRLILGGQADRAPRRVHALESPKHRQQLADDLRWHLAAATRGESPLGRYEREALVERADLVRSLAATVELDEVDPAALVLLHWVVQGPPPAEARTEADAGRELGRRLERARALIAGRTAGRPSRATGIAVT